MLWASQDWPPAIGEVRKVDALTSPARSSAVSKPSSDGRLNRWKPILIEHAPPIGFEKHQQHVDITELGEQTFRRQIGELVDGNPFLEVTKRGQHAPAAVGLAPKGAAGPGVDQSIEA